MESPQTARSQRAMPKRLLFTAIALASVLAACNSAQPDFGGGPVPTSTASATPNPNITQATVTAVYQGIAQSNVTICESLGTSGGCYSRGGTPITTMTTNNLGQAIFTSLTPGTVYCWEAQINGTILNNCTSNWQQGVQIGS